MAVSFLVLGVPLVLTLASGGVRLVMKQEALHFALNCRTSAPTVPQNNAFLKSSHITFIAFAFVLYCTECIKIERALRGLGRAVKFRISSYAGHSL